MGADFENKGERVYRLLGCELTYRDKLPAVGDTLRYDIHLDGYAKQGDIRLFFFHYNCEIGGKVHLEVRRGQAGFFTYEELANSTGVVWDAKQANVRSELTVASGPCHTQKRRFSHAEIRAFTQGDLVTCFGDEFYPANCHQRTPTIVSGDFLMFDELLELDHAGGPWQRGYLKAELKVKPDHWFFAGHFKNDPCAPGTLMLEGGVQVLSFYLASMGFTLARDGWRFEPIKDETFNLICRSQLIPGGEKLVYEIFVHGVEAHPRPQLRVDLLCTVDGRKAFLGQGVGIELVPGWPVESRLDFLPHGVESNASGLAREGEFLFDERAMIACAWGKPSDAFGPHYQKHDGPRRGPRLPGYPYHFISRIVSVSVAPRQMQAGASAVMAYDIPADAWYFSENSQPTMPFPVLLEAALQPCGWLATYIGGGFSGNQEVFFRNLDGSATQHREVTPADDTLITEVELTRVSAMGSMTIVGFLVKTSVIKNDQKDLVYEMDTVFGFFPAESLAQQAGLPATEEERLAFAEPSESTSLLYHRPAEYFAGRLRLPGPMLNLLDSVTGYWPDGGTHNKGRVRGRMQVDSQAWFFKSHFYGDPVQPGSLGLEMMLQCLQFYALRNNFASDMTAPRFSVPGNGQQHSWSYRGQVLPKNKEVICDLHVVDVSRTGTEVLISANASLWVDSQKIYKADNISLAIVSETDHDRAHTRMSDRTFNLIADPWINDHCPTYTLPVLPFMSLADVTGEAAIERVPARKLLGLRNVRVSRWASFTSPSVSIRRWGVATSAREVSVQLTRWNTDEQRYQELAEGCVLVGEEYELAPQPWAALKGGETIQDIYDSGNLFHGPALRGLTTLQLSDEGASGLVDMARIDVPVGLIHPGFLDACLHVIPHAALHRWFPALDSSGVGYPLKLDVADFYGPTPTTGTFRVEARPRGFDNALGLPRVGLQIIAENNQVWAELVLVEAQLPKGRLGSATPADRERFFAKHQYVRDLRLSTPSEQDAGAASLNREAVTASNWLPGSLQALYDFPVRDYERLTQAILAKEQLAAHWQIHPSRVLLLPAAPADSASAPCSNDGQFIALHGDQLLKAASVSVTSSNGSDFSARIDAVSDNALTLRWVRDFWRSQLATQDGLAEDFFMALVAKFTGQIKAFSAESAGLAPLGAGNKRGVLYVANHQTGVESVLFCIVMSALRRQPVFALAKKEHADSWIGRMLKVLFEHTETPPSLLTLMDREDAQAVWRTIESSMGRLVNGSHSMLVHVAGTRAQMARERQTVLSGSLIDAALAQDLDIVPVRFHGGLPLEPASTRLEFPYGYGRQHWTLGKPIRAAELAHLDTRRRKEHILSALNELNGLLVREHPSSPDVTFAQEVAELQDAHSCLETQAVLRRCLIDTPFELSLEGRHILAVAQGKGAQNKMPVTIAEHLARVRKITLGDH